MRECSRSAIALFDLRSHELPDGKWKPLLADNGKPMVSMAFEDRASAASMTCVRASSSRIVAP
jgi:hypothetical protein